MQKYEQVMMTSKKAIIINNLLGGIAWGIGATLGVTILLTLLGVFLSELNTVPIVGNYVTEVTKYVNQHTQNYRR